MSTRPFVVTTSAMSTPISVLGIRITVLAANTATQGYEITLQEGDEGAGPPPHSHDWDESFYVLRGEVEITCQGQVTTLAAGLARHVPRGTVHAYRFGPTAAGCSKSRAKAARDANVHERRARSFRARRRYPEAARPIARERRTHRRLIRRSEPAAWPSLRDSDAPR